MPTTGQFDAYSTGSQVTGNGRTPRLGSGILRNVLYSLQVLLLSSPSRRRTSRLLSAAFLVWYRFHQITREGLKFMAVGTAGFALDLAVFNTLLFAGGGVGPLHDSPLFAKTVAVVAATVLTFAGNRLWTFRHRARTGVAREYTLFFLFNGVGLGIALACLGVSRYLLGLSGPLADNVSANVIGLVFGTAFRFWSYRTWVFPDPARMRSQKSPAVAEGATAEPAFATTR
jgi:putative flippase GtrA